MYRTFFRSILLVALIALSLALAGPLYGMMQSQSATPPRAPQRPASSGSENYTLVNSIFASGNTGTVMDSESYQMRGTLGEPGLPDNETDLVSANFVHQPGFLAANALSTLYLPLLARNYDPCALGPAGRVEVEDNDTKDTANGPLCSGVTYQANPDDVNDYFSFYLAAPGTLTVDLTNHTGTGRQLQLLDATETIVGYSGGPTTYHIDCPDPLYPNCGSQAGWYYVRVYTGGGYNSTPYNLVVTYP